MSKGSTDDRVHYWDECIIPLPDGEDWQVVPSGYRTIKQQVDLFARYAADQPEDTP